MKFRKFQKILTIILIIIFLTNGFNFYQPKKTEAIVGFITAALSFLKEAKDIVLPALELAAKTTLEVTKKRFLDAIVDDIISWIQTGDVWGTGEGQKFVLNWKRYLNNAFQAAVGDVAQEIGLGFLCQPFKTQLQILLRPPRKFARAAECTLEQIVGNIENYIQDFKEGGWIAYSESLAPQNNPLGIFLLTADEVLNRTQREANAALNEAQASSGFLGGKMCIEYTNIKTGETTKDMGKIKGPDREYGASEINDLLKNYSSLSNEMKVWLSDLKCTDYEIATPGAAAAQSIAEAIGSDIKYIVNATELSHYLAAIIDAFISRAIKDGIKYVTKSDKSVGTTRFADIAQQTGYYQASTNRMMANVSSSIEVVSSTIEALNEILKVLQEQDSSIDSLKNDLENLNSSGNFSCESSTLENAINLASTTKVTISQLRVEINDYIVKLQDLLTQLKKITDPQNYNENSGILIATNHLINEINRKNYGDKIGHIDNTIGNLNRTKNECQPKSSS